MLPGAKSRDIPSCEDSRCRWAIFPSSPAIKTNEMQIRDIFLQTWILFWQIKYFFHLKISTTLYTHYKNLANFKDVLSISLSLTAWTLIFKFSDLCKFSMNTFAADPFFHFHYRSFLHGSISCCLVHCLPSTSRACLAASLTSSLSVRHRYTSCSMLSLACDAQTQTARHFT